MVPEDKPDSLKHVNMNFNEKYMSTDNTMVQFSCYYT